MIIVKRTFILCLFIFSCTRNTKKDYCCDDQVEQIKKLSMDVCFSNLHTNELIAKYFYNPNEIINCLTEDGLILYDAHFNYFKRYVIQGTGELHLICGKELLNSPYFSWLYRYKYEKQVICMYFYDEKYKTISTLSFYFFDNKIVSFIPLGAVNTNAVMWMRCPKATRALSK